MRRRKTAGNARKPAGGPAELKDAKPDAYRRFTNAYRAIAIFMIVSIGFAVLMNIFYKGSWILIAEAFGIWAFGACWFVKDRKLEEVKKILKGKGPATAPAPQIGKSTADIVDAL